MTLQKVRIIAKSMGIKNINRYRKENLIRIIQQSEGNAPCYKGIDGCGEIQCLWRGECQQ